LLLAEWQHCQCLKVFFCGLGCSSFSFWDVLNEIDIDLNHVKNATNIKQHHNTTTPQHHNTTTTPQHHTTTPQQHNNTTTQQQQDASVSKSNTTTNTTSCM